MSIHIAIHGVAGRMGRLILSRVLESDDLILAAAWEHSEHPAQRQEAASLVSMNDGAIRVSDEFSEQADVIVDFSLPQGTQSLLSHLLTQDQPPALLSGTTGLSSEMDEQLNELSAKTAVLHAPNFSLGVNLLHHLVNQAAKALPEGYDIEIVETHHRNKQDAPSGTAMLLGHAAAQARGVSLPGEGVFTRHGHVGPRPAGSIGFATLRGGGVVGEHDVNFLGDQETVSLSHRALTRDVFADGAIHALRFLHGKPAGRYTMLDVLGLR